MYATKQVQGLSDQRLGHATRSVIRSPAPRPHASGQWLAPRQLVEGGTQPPENRSPESRVVGRV
jgi:hypothetical protein